MQCVATHMPSRECFGRSNFSIRSHEIIDKNLNTQNIHYLACVVQYNLVVCGMNVIKLSIRAECHTYSWYMQNVLTLSVIVSVVILSVLSKV